MIKSWAEQTLTQMHYTTELCCFVWGESYTKALKSAELKAHKQWQLNLLLREMK